MGCPTTSAGVRRLRLKRWSRGNGGSLDQPKGPPCDRVQHRPRPDAQPLNFVRYPWKASCCDIDSTAGRVVHEAPTGAGYHNHSRERRETYRAAPSTPHWCRRSRAPAFDATDVPLPKSPLPTPDRHAQPTDVTQSPRSHSEDLSILPDPQ